ncbi:polygalacturonase-like [Bidens hawaiensis]|uniref:polygalacturonase-like n=1 Tax=Bidens hawaiensis TaxID=980011 RepID=UPI00404A5473
MVLFQPQNLFDVKQEHGGALGVDNVTHLVIGNIIAIPMSAWPRNTDTWIKFHNVPNLHVVGQNGRFIGQGKDWWDACQRTKPTTCEKNNPTALAFHSCPGLVLNQVTSINSPRNHISINACNGATIYNINIQAPGENAPNTDGIDISDTTGVHVIGGNIGTGDDCINKKI